MLKNFKHDQQKKKKTFNLQREIKADQKKVEEEEEKVGKAN